MTPQEIITDLKSRGEKDIQFSSDGSYIISRHGSNTVNYWVVENGSLVCIDCKTTSY